jgi:undecaprenyl diphosphate synthase
LALLPASTTEALKSAESATRDDNKLLLNVGVGYGGRQEIIEAVKGYLQ